MEEEQEERGGRMEEGSEGFEVNLFTYFTIS